METLQVPTPAGSQITQGDQATIKLLPVFIGLGSTVQLKPVSVPVQDLENNAAIEKEVLEWGKALIGNDQLHDLLCLISFTIVYTTAKLHEDMANATALNHGTAKQVEIWFEKPSVSVSPGFVPEKLTRFLPPREFNFYMARCMKLAETVVDVGSEVQGHRV